MKFQQPHYLESHLNPVRVGLVEKRKNTYGAAAAIFMENKGMFGTGCGVVVYKST